MQSSHQHLIEYKYFEDFIDYLNANHNQLEYNKQYHKLNLTEHIQVRLPLCIRYESAVSFSECNFLIIIIHSGEAALAYSEEDQITEHKVEKAYMVRKKQGKSQIKYLKTKGKSKAGSRVRLAGTDHFFEVINKKIEEWNDYYDIDHIALSCNKTLQPFLFNRSDAAFKKEDERLFKIPKHIQEATFDNLIDIHQYLTSFEIKFEEGQREFVKQMIETIRYE